jgi:predicted nucleotidyltransferase
MVDFETNDPIEYTDNYFDLKFELERILNRSIDLLENKAIKNPFLRENIDKSKVLIYGQ